MSDRSESERLAEETTFQRLSRRPEVGAFVVMVVIIIALAFASDGKAFNAHPGCINTTVLRGIGVGKIATNALWDSVEDFTQAFSTQTGRPVATTDDINDEAARMTRGLIRTDYHTYELFSYREQNR